MKSYIAYFDLLGFKYFIEKNNIEEQQKGIHNIFRDIENAISLGKTIPAEYGVVADLSNSKIQTLNFSDTILFWSLDDSKESLFEILEIAYLYNWRGTGYTFPSRGTLAYGDVTHIKFEASNHRGGLYSVNSVYGKGLIDAYQMAESMDWSGAIVDVSVVNRIAEFGLNPDSILDKYAKKYPVPFKDGSTREEFAFKLVVEPINQIAFDNRSKSIRENFAAYKKPVNDPRTQKKIQNTLDFLKSSVR